MNKIIHIYRKGQRICDIAKIYGISVSQIANDNLITNIDIIDDFTPIIIDLKSKCKDTEQLYCNVEKRGCYGCYYFK